jgi:succinoglycan biosynthesis protein ExoV
MLLHYWKSSHGNFGDDLNLWLWQALLPGLWDPADQVVFVGVGTILNHGVPKGRRRVVLGSGVGYAPLPSDLKASDWRIYGVRGPLTARALELPSSAALSDGALLLRTLPRPDPPPVPGSVIFVPHWRTAAAGDWASIAGEAGLRYVDPRQDSRQVIAELAGARLVVAESMHGAIIADAYRVPWVAMAGSAEVSWFKWLDWARSLDLPYRPRHLPASCLTELAQRLASPLCGLDFRDRRAARLADEGALVASSLAASARRQSRSRQRIHRRAQRAMTRFVLPGAGRLGRLGFDRLARERAVAALAAAARDPGQLSDDRSIERATTQLQDALERLRRDYRAGFA